MAYVHLNDVFRGGLTGGALEITIPAWASRDIGEERVRYVLAALCHHANDHNLAYPSAATLAFETDVPERKVRVALRVLEDNGIIIRVGPAWAGKRGVQFRINTPSVAVYPQPVTGQSADGPDSGLPQRTPVVTTWYTSTRTPLRTDSLTDACGKDEVDPDREREDESALITAEECFALLEELKRLLPNLVDPLESRLVMRVMAAVGAVGKGGLQTAAQLLAANPSSGFTGLGQWLDSISGSRSRRIAQ